MKREHLTAVAVLAMLALGSQPVHSQDIEARGKALVDTNCARCHAVGKTGQSNHPEAPAFRTLSQRYPIDALEEAFVEGIYTGHPDMPEFIATPEQIEAIIAYIWSIQVK